MRLRARLFWSVCPLTLIGVLALGTLVYVQLRGQERSDLERSLDLALFQAIDRTDTFVRSTETNTDLLANASSVRTYLQAEKSSRARELRTLFGNIRAAYPDYREIRLVRPDGREALRSAEPGSVRAGDDAAGEEWFLRASLATTFGDPRPVSLFTRSAGTGGFALVIAQPIHPDATPANDLSASPFGKRRVLGYLVVTASPGFLSRPGVTRGLGENGYLVVADASGRTLFDSSVPSVSTAPGAPTATDVPGVPNGPAAALPVEIGLSSTGRFDLGDGLTERRRLLGDISITAILPKSALAATSGRLTFTVVAAGVVTLIVVSGVLLLLLRSIVVRPLAELGRAALAVSEGDLDAPIVTSRRDEIGTLGRAISRMRRKLVDSMLELRASHVEIERLAYRDTLTGLPNRRSFIDGLDAALARQLGTDAALALLYLDLDKFKQVNDTLGHEAGDELLRRTARRLESLFEGSDPRLGGLSGTVARLGGDEFTVVVENVRDERRIVPMAEAVVEALGAEVHFEGREFAVETSIGIALAGAAMAPCIDREELIKRADVAMYEAKRETRRRYCFHGAPMQAAANRRLLLAQALPVALDTGELELAYQPQFSADGLALVGVEALLRWRRPDGELVSPAEFVPIAERTGLVGRLGLWVLDRACRQWCEWSAAGIAPSRVAVNVSHRQFAACDMAEAVSEVLERTGMPAPALEIELTETCMMDATGETVRVLERVRTLGVRVAMDDFGTGYSSLAALTSLPIDTLKIDRQFVTDVAPDTAADKIVSAIITLAVSLGLEVIAEGVETEDELALLQARGCDLIQGYLLARPMSVADMSAMLVERAGELRRAA